MTKEALATVVSIRTTTPELWASSSRAMATLTTEQKAFCSSNLGSMRNCGAVPVAARFASWIFDGAGAGESDGTTGSVERASVEGQR